MKLDVVDLIFEAMNYAIQIVNIWNIKGLHISGCKEIEIRKIELQVINFLVKYIQRA